MDDRDAGNPGTTSTAFADRGDAGEAGVGAGPGVGAGAGSGPVVGPASTGAVNGGGSSLAAKADDGAVNPTHRTAAAIRRMATPSSVKLPCLRRVRPASTFP